jgi:hypothetical protein
MIIFKQRKTQSRTSIDITHEYILVTDDKYSRPYTLNGIKTLISVSKARKKN